MAGILDQLAKHGVVPTAESRELTKYALAKPGVRPASSVAYDSEEVLLALPKLEVPGPTWRMFFDVDYLDGPWATLYARASALSGYRKRFPLIRKADWSPRDGHIAILVPLSGQIPIATLRQLVDEAYELVIDKLSEKQQSMLALEQDSLDDEQLLDQLIDQHKMQRDRATIKGLARLALQLATRKVSDRSIKVGISRLGGRPDLPTEAEWPRLSNRPLAFLGQLNLVDMAKCGTPFPRLPATGLLSIFSIWGWAAEEDGDALDDYRPESDASQPDWTRITYFRKRVPLERRAPPRGVPRFEPCAIEFESKLSLPTSRLEPSIRALKWERKKVERLVDLTQCFDELQWAGGSPIGKCSRSSTSARRIRSFSTRVSPRG